MIDIVFSDKHSRIAIKTLYPTAKKVLNNKVHTLFLVDPFIENINMRLYSDLLKTLKFNYLMGQGNYPRDIDTA